MSSNTKQYEHGSISITEALLHSPPNTYYLLWKYDYGDTTEGFMTVDHRIAWDSDKRERAQALASIVIVLFPVGVPLALFILLFVNRDQIMQRQTRSGGQELDIVGA